MTQEKILIDSGGLSILFRKIKNHLNYTKKNNSGKNKINKHLAPIQMH